MGCFKKSDQQVITLKIFFEIFSARVYWAEIHFTPIK